MGAYSGHCAAEREYAGQNRKWDVGQLVDGYDSSMGYVGAIGWNEEADRGVSGYECGYVVAPGYHATYKSVGGGLGGE